MTWSTPHGLLSHLLHKNKTVFKTVFFKIVIQVSDIQTLKVNGFSCVIFNILHHSSFFLSHISPFALLNACGCKHKPERN